MYGSYYAGEGEKVNPLFLKKLSVSEAIACSLHAYENTQDGQCRQDADVSCHVHRSIRFP